MSVAAQEIFLRRLELGGFIGASVEARDSLLIVKVRVEDQGRLLADAPLREALVREAKHAGFSRLALEITHPV